MNKEINHFTDLDAWKINYELTLIIYRITEKFPKSEKFGIIDQLRRASSSIIANIAEGWGRYHFSDKIRFFYQARGSNAEVQNFIILAKGLGYLNQEDYDRIEMITIQGFKIINGLIRSTEKQKTLNSK
ncbi:MAG: four helix bundle protein [Minisyncoccia bacterium]